MRPAPLQHFQSQLVRMLPPCMKEQPLWTKLQAPFAFLNISSDGPAAGYAQLPRYSPTFYRAQSESAAAAATIAARYRKRNLASVNRTISIISLQNGPKGALGRQSDTWSERELPETARYPPPRITSISVESSVTRNAGFRDRASPSVTLIRRAFVAFETRNVVQSTLAPIV